MLKVICGTSDITLLIQTIHCAKIVAMNNNDEDIKGINGANTAAIKPRIVIGAITGATKILAGTETIASWLEIKTITGKQKIVALNGIAIDSANNLLFTTPTNLLDRDGESMRMPAVAKTERAKPGSLD